MGIKDDQPIEEVHDAPYLPLSNEIEISDDTRLNQLGYKRELSRNLSAISNFAVTFSIISVLTGITTLFSTGLEFGGPATMVYGWPIAGALTLMVGTAMAEICSAFPTSGGLYFWSAKLAGGEWGPFASWITGWLLREQFEMGDQLGSFSRVGMLPNVSTQAHSTTVVVKGHMYTSKRRL